MRAITSRTGIEIVDEQGAQLALLDDVGRLAVTLWHNEQSIEFTAESQKT